MSSLSFKLHSLWNHTSASITTTKTSTYPSSLSKPNRKCIKQRRQRHRKWFIKKSIQLSSILFMVILIIIFDNNKNVYSCDAVPLSSSSSSSSASSSSSILPTDKLININTGEVALKRIASDTINRVGNLSRHHTGDVFNAYDIETCDTDTCVGMSSGTADIFKNENREIDTKLSSRTTSTSTTAHECKCQCLPHLQTYREDLSICVDDIHECTLAPFISGSSSEKIPFVFLPLRGQIIHPSKEISFQGVKTPICAVSSSQYLTQTGWSELRNPSDNDVPFRLFRDEGRTFLQWLGEPDLRYRMQGRLILVHLMCRDIIPSVPSAPEELENDYLSDTKTEVKVPNIFQHCVAFRVYGTPMKHVNNVTEVSFQSEIQSNVPTITSNGLSTKEYIAIGACSILLGLIYVASVFLYIHVKKRKSSRNSSINDINNGGNGGGGGIGGGGSNSSGNNSNSGLDDSITTTTAHSMKNDQITYGPPFNRNNGGSMNGSYRTGRNVIDRQGSYRNGSSSSGGNELNGEQIGIIKNNPLLKHYPNLSNDNSGFLSDFSNSNSECEDECMNSDIKMNMQSSVILHPNGLREMIERRQYHQDVNNQNHQSMNNQESECLPEENVSIVEDMSTDDKLENMKAIVNGTIRRKLYFNPAYFEPHLLLSPPPAAVEFLTKIREVITIAKYKMATKRFQPSLIVIPEEKNKISELYSTKSSIMINNTNNNNNNNTNIDDSILNNNNTNNNDLHEQTKCIGCSNCVQISDNNNDISDSNNNGNNTSNGNNNNNNNNNKTTNNCKNCGDKRNSIHKWLEDVTNHGNEHELFDEDDEIKKINVDNDENSKTATTTSTTEMTDKSVTDSVQKNDSISSESSDQDSSDTTTKGNNSNSLKSSNKRKAPPIPITAPPKIISHFLKQKPLNNESLKIPSAKNSILSATPLSSSIIANTNDQTESFEIEDEMHNNNNNNNTSNSLYVKNPSKMYTNKNDIYNASQHRILSPPPLPTTTTGNELYNNPQFQIISDPHDSQSSTLSIQRRKMNNKVNYNEDANSNSSMQKLRQSKKSSKLEVLDQYANNSSPVTTLNSQHQNDMLLKNTQNDMIYDALSIKDYPLMDDSLLLNRPPDDTSSYSFSLPTPDYDDLYSTYSKQKYGYNNMENVFVPVPTPDYNTYGRSGGGSISSGGRKQYQPPDSPIYSRKSPHHLIVDYETDSLERSTLNKKYINGNNNNNNGTMSSTSSSRHGDNNHKTSLKKPIAAKKPFLPQSNINNGTSTPTQPPSLSSIMARDIKQSMKSTMPQLGTTPTTATTTTTTTDSSITNSDLSSQPSPSLSVALPLEEEVEIGNTIYGRREDYKCRATNVNDPTTKDYSKLLAKNIPTKNKSLSNKSTYDEIYINKNLFEPTEPLIKYNTPFHGSMTIEVKHNPVDCEISTAEDSDQFEPDTLDRKPKNKQLLANGNNNNNNNKVLQINQHLDTSPWSHDTFFDRFNDKLRYSSLENMTSLPEMSNFLGITDSPTNTTTTNKNINTNNNNNNNSKSCTNTLSNNRLILRSNGSFKCSSSINNISDLGIYGGNNGPNLQRNFGSLREIYEAKNLQRTNLKNAQSISNNSINFLDDKGRLLTLEARHSKRQRQTNGAVESKQKQNFVLPPSVDIIPFDLNSLKSNASKTSKASSRPQTKNNQTNQKNSMGWNTNNNNNGNIYQEQDHHHHHQKNTDYDTYYTTANEIIIGRSDTEKNSDFYSSVKQSNHFHSSPHHHHHHHQQHNHHQHNNNNHSQLGSQLRKSNSINGFSNRKRSDMMINVNNSYHNYNNRPLNKLISIRPPKHPPPPPPPASIPIASVIPIQILEKHLSLESNNNKDNNDINKLEILKLSKSSRSINKHKHLRTLADYDNLYDDDDDDDNRFDPNCSISSTDSANSNSSNNTGNSSSNCSTNNSTSPNHITNGTTSKIFRVDVNPTTHGMQIALGIKDRVKKSKDLKNAWKRFVSLATSKFINHQISSPTATPPQSQNNQNQNQNNKNNGKVQKSDLDYFEKISNQSDSLEKDEGISSLIDENIIILDGGNNHRTSQKHDNADDKQSINCNTNNNINNNNQSNNKGKLSRNSSINSTSEHYENNSINNNNNSNSNNIINNSSSNNNNNNNNVIKRSDLDGGYMSADSNESKLNSKKLYERFNFNSKFRRSAPAINSAINQTTNSINNDVDVVNNEIKNNYKFMQKIKEGTELITDKFLSNKQSLNNNNNHLQNEKLKSSKQNFITNNNNNNNSNSKKNIDCKMKIINENDILPSEFMSKNFILQIQNLYSSSDDDDMADDDDDDDVHDGCRSDRDDATDDDEFNNLDDICESGAESIETNSVFFKNIRKFNKE